MSTCLKTETLLAFADSELASGEMELTEMHIAACSSCRQQLDSVRAASLKVNALIGSLAPDEATDAEQVAVIRIPEKAANPGMHWVSVAAVGVLVMALAIFVMIRRTHTDAPSDVAETVALAPVPAAEKKDVVLTPVTKPADVGVPRAHARVQQFQALDNGAPIETGMIYRVSLPSTTSRDANATQSAKRIPAEVIVDEFGKVRAIRFLQ
jgi:hypothetical protein